jgi:hypothetical protein
MGSSLWRWQWKKNGTEAACISRSHRAYRCDAPAGNEVELELELELELECQTTRSRAFMQMLRLQRAVRQSTHHQLTIMIDA